MKEEKEEQGENFQMNEELKKAYEVLGLPEDATKEQIEKRYFMLVRKYRSRMLDQNNENNDDDYNIDEINRAYNLILEYERRQANEEYRQKHYSRFKRIDMEKIDHFFHYYKIHLLVAIIVVVAIVFGIKGYLDKRAEREAEAKLPPIQLSVLFFGEYYASDESESEKIENNILQQFPEWKRVKVQISYVPEVARNEYDIAMQQKSIITLISERPDIYIVDEFNFNRLLSQGIFSPLDDKAQTLLQQLPQDDIYSGVAGEGQEKRIYGIDVTDSPLLQGVNMSGKKLIATLRADAEKEENALKLIEWLVSAKLSG